MTSPAAPPLSAAERAKLEQELVTLDESRQQLDRRIRDATDRQRYGGDGRAVEDARRDEQALLVEMDRLMTRIRAVEAKLLLVRKGAERPPRPF